MKILSTSLKALVVASMACAAGIAAAADTQDLFVTAKVTKACTFTGSAQTLNFGDLDPSAAADKSGSGAAVTFKCTKGTVISTVSVGQGLNGANEMKNTANTDKIPYTLTAVAAGNGKGFSAGNDAAITLTSNVAAAAYEDVSAGTYEDTVVLTLNY